MSAIATTIRTTGARTHPYTPPRAQARRFFATAAAGFTLIEVLISIIILALGLLGIGVVFPVVIRQQRISTDEVAGILMARNTAAKVLSRSGVEYEPPAAPPGIGERTVWYWWREHFKASLNWNDYTEGRWQFVECGDDGEMELAPKDFLAGLFPTNTRVIYSADMPTTPPDLEQAYSRVEWPYVWDMTVQPVYDGDTDVSDDSLRIAVFVRRIDSRTRADLPPPNTDPEPLPVAIESDTGLPTVDRRVGQTRIEYANPVVMKARIDEKPDNTVDREHLIFNNGNDNQWAIFSQPGQKLVDSLGNIYTVQRGFVGEEDGEQKVRISPPIPATITEAMTPLDLWFVTTPQPAVAVYTFEVTP